MRLKKAGLAVAMLALTGAGRVVNAQSPALRTAAEGFVAADIAPPAPSPPELKGTEYPVVPSAFLKALDDPTGLPPVAQNPGPPELPPLGDINTLPAPQWQMETEAMLSGPVPIGLGLPAQMPGWVGNIDVGIVQPYIGSKINSGTDLDGTFPGNPVALPIGALNFTATPRFEIGYRWPEGLGEIRGTYTRIQATGNRTIPDQLPGFTRALRTRLQMNVVDFDYCFSEFNLGDIPLIPTMAQTPGWLGLRRPPTIYQNDPLAIRFRLGGRAATMFLDAQATGAQVLNERMMNNFAGAGFHVAVEGTKAMPWRPLSLYGKLDFAGVLGTVQQNFERTDALGNSAQSAVDTEVGVPCFGMEWGLQYVPASISNFRASMSYQYGHWWQFADTDDSTAIFQTNGVLLSGQWGF